LNKREQRKNLREAAKWLMGLTNDRDWGLKVWDDLEQKSVPKHVNRKETFLSFLKNVPFAYPRRLTQKVLIQHFLGQKTVYFTGSRGDETIVMLDIDCAPDVTGLPWQQGQARETLLTMLLNRGRLVGHRT